MTIRLFHSPASPYVRKVLVAAHERGLADQIELLASAAGPVVRDMTVVAHNASGKVPCALLDDDQPVFDSRVICAYVDSLAAPEGTLYPQGARRFQVLTLEALADGVLDACLLCRYEDVMRPQNLRWQDWYQGQMDKIDSGLEALETRWFDLLSQGFHAGAVATVCMLGYLDFRFPDKDWRSNHPRLAKWYDAALKRASVKATMPSG